MGCGTDRCIVRSCERSGFSHVLCVCVCVGGAHSWPSMNLCRNIHGMPNKLAVCRKHSERTHRLMVVGGHPEIVGRGRASPAPLPASGADQYCRPRSLSCAVCDCDNERNCTCAYLLARGCMQYFSRLHGPAQVDTVYSIARRTWCSAGAGTGTSTVPADNSSVPAGPRRMKMLALRFDESE